MFHDDITNDPDGAAAVYRTNRLGGNFEYSFGPADGLVASRKCTLTLHFCELYFDSASERLFSVTANGNQSLLTSFDVYSVAGGKDTPIFKTFQVAADTNGILSLQFAASVNNAILAGIHVSDNTPAGTFPPALPPAGGLAPRGSPVGPPEPATANGTPPAAEPPESLGAVPPMPGAGLLVPGQPHAAGGPAQSPSRATLAPTMPPMGALSPAVPPADSPATSSPTPTATLQPINPPSSPIPIIAQGTPVLATGTSTRSGGVLWISKGQLAGIIRGIFFGLLIILLIIIGGLALLFLKHVRNRQDELIAKHSRSVHTVMIDAQA
ncbi:g5984 [Coccomyxa elongata]